MKSEITEKEKICCEEPNCKHGNFFDGEPVEWNGNTFDPKFDSFAEHTFDSEGKKW